MESSLKSGSLDDSEKLMGEFIKMQEKLFLQMTGYIQKLMIEYLINLGYKLNDIELNKSYEVIISDKEKFITSVDILLILEGKVVYAIKCAPASIDSWERFMLAFCRVVEPYQIPFAMITDGKEGRVIDVLTGKVKETLEIPKKEDLLNTLSSLSFIPCSEEKISKEKRILYAFDAIKCCPIYSL